MSVAKQSRGKSPAQILVFGFGSMILVGAFLLSLPLASASGTSIGFLDALFTSTSGVCVTGLTIFDPGSTLSLFGQIVLLLLIQLGGIGFMTMTSMIYMIMRKRITLKDRVAIRDSLNEDRLSGVVRMTRNVVIVTACAEIMGILLLCIRFIPEYGVSTGLYYSIFHSVSSFCNAGFDVFGLGNNLIPYVADPLVNIVTMLLIIFGGLGFFVVVELYQKLTGKSRRRRLSFHTRMVLIITGILIVFGFVVFLIAESGNPRTLGASGVSTEQKILSSLFQSVSPRTAGFMSINQNDLMPVSKIVTVALMFIGASPSGTGGGLKTTTTALVFLFVLSILKGKEDVEVAERRINKHLVLRAIAIFTLGIVAVLAISGILSVIEHGTISPTDLIFETTSAFGTVGLSTGITPMLGPISRILLIITMLGGRVGIFTFTLALAKRLARQKVNVRYPEDKIMIG